MDRSMTNRGIYVWNMLNAIKKYGFIMVSLFHLGCSDGPKTINEFLGDPSNGYNTTEVGFDAMFSFTRIPTEILMREHYPDILEVQDKISIEREYNSMLHFKLELEPIAQNFGEIKEQRFFNASPGEIVNFLSFDFEKSVVLLSGSDTIPCAYSHMVREFDVSHKTRVNFGFQRPKTFADSLKIIGALELIGAPYLEVQLPAHPASVPKHLIQ